MRLTLVLLILTFGVAPFASAAGGRRAMAVDDLFRVRRVSDPQLSPDGKWVVYVVANIDVGKNASQSHLWLAPTDGSAPPRQFTTGERKDKHPRWSPDGKRILFESNRSGAGQLWVIPVAGGEATQLTSLSTEASTGVWSPDGKQVAFVSAVYPEFSALPFAESDAANRKRTEEIAKSPVKAKVFRRLFYRHWDSYVEDKRQHLFVVSAEGGEPRDVTPGDRDAYPTSSTFSVGDDFVFSPNGEFLIFNAVPKENEAWNTNMDLCRVSVQGKATESWETLTKNPAADGSPVLSADGRFLAYRSQKRPGFEADKWELQVQAIDANGNFVGAPKTLLGDWDASIDAIAWSASKLIVTAELKGNIAIARVDPVSGKMAMLLEVGGNSAISVSGDGQRIAIQQSKFDASPDVWIGSLAGAGPLALENVSRANNGLLGELELGQPESVTVSGAGGTPMQMWILNPPGFDPAKKWPLVYLVHGGPQGAWANSWNYRWNAQIWAAQGYVVAMPNPRGSTGFGQKYVDEISGDWGGKCYEDLMAGLAWLEAKPYIDRDRMASAGASFGGYMMNWFQANTTKFKTLINHCGVFNFESMYATTEELWFDEWEHGGPPWGPNPHSYEKHSPHKKAKNFKTPMLIIHNDLDFRVPVSEAHQLFTTLQRLGIPSKFINFPDEGHWVLKPANSQYWHREIFAWLKQYCPPGGR